MYSRTLMVTTLQALQVVHMVLRNSVTEMHNLVYRLLAIYHI